MVVFRPITIRGTRYDFKHLEPMEIEVKENSSGKSPKKPYHVLVNFSCHCFTEEYDATKHTQQDRYMHDGELRAFCPIRYEHSTKLPGIVKAFGKKDAYLTQQNNYMIVQRKTEAGPTKRYVIFFTVEKGPRHGADVVVTIASAYDKLELTKKASCISFSTLVGKTHRGEKIKPAGRSYIPRKGPTRRPRKK